MVAGTVRGRGGDGAEGGSPGSHRRGPAPGATAPRRSHGGGAARGGRAIRAGRPAAVAVRAVRADSGAGRCPVAAGPQPRAVIRGQRRPGGFPGSVPGARPQRHALAHRAIRRSARVPAALALVGPVTGHRPRGRADRPGYGLPHPVRRGQPGHAARRCRSPAEHVELLRHRRPGQLAHRANYAGVLCPDVHPNIDLLCCGNACGQAEYDFVVVMGAGPSQIRLNVAGGDTATLDGQANLMLHSVLVRPRQSPQRVDTLRRMKRTLAAWHGTRHREGRGCDAGPRQGGSTAVAVEGPPRPDVRAPNPHGAPRRRSARRRRWSERLSRLTGRACARGCTPVAYPAAGMIYWRRQICFQSRVATAEARRHGRLTVVPPEPV
jgi:hypothetical protein